MSSTVQAGAPPPTCEHVQANATGLCALAPDDPERVAAERHAATCPACAKALAQGQETLRWIDEAATLVPMPAAELSRLHARVLHAVQVDAHRRQRWLPLTPVLTLAQAAVLLVIYPPHDLEHGLHAIGLCLSAALGLWAMLASSHSRARMVGGLLIWSAAVASALSQVPQSDLAVRAGLHCLGFEIACAAMPWAVAAWQVRVGHLEQPARVLALHGLAGSVVGQAILLAACPVESNLGHVLTFHLLGVGVSTILGYGLGTWLKRPLAASDIG